MYNFQRQIMNNDILPIDNIVNRTKKKKGNARTPGLIESDLNIVPSLICSSLVWIQRLKRTTVRRKIKKKYMHYKAMKQNVILNRINREYYPATEIILEIIISQRAL